MVRQLLYAFMLERQLLLSQERFPRPLLSCFYLSYMLRLYAMINSLRGGYREPRDRNLGLHLYLPC